MEISHPRRILAIGSPGSDILSFLKDLTGTAPPEPVLSSSSSLPTKTDPSLSSKIPEPSSTSTPLDTNTLPPRPRSSIAGLSHQWTLKTRYYTATIPIWIDEIESAPEWAAEFSSPAAEEVLGVVGAWVVVFRKPLDREEMDTIKACLKAVADVHAHSGEAAGGGSGGGDVALLAVATPQSITPSLEISTEQWEDLCRELGGFEYVDTEASGKNEYGEPVGIARAREALESNDWEGDDQLLSLDDLSNDDDDDEASEDDAPLDKEAMDVWREMFGLRQSIAGQDPDGEEGGATTDERAIGNPRNEDADQEAQVDQLETMMKKMLAVREMGMDTEMSERDRKRLAARTVGEIMRER